MTARAMWRLGGMMMPMTTMSPMTRGRQRMAHVLRVFMMGCAALGMACSGDSSSLPTVSPSPSTPQIQAVKAISVIRTAELTMLQGRGGGIGMAIERRNGFAGDVTLSVENVPNGVTLIGIWPGTILPAANKQFSLDLSIADNATPGQYPITVRGRALGIPDSTATIWLTVGTAPFLITAPPTLPLFPGADASVSVAITRQGGMDAPVTVYLEGGMTGVTISPASVTTTGTVATFSAHAESNASGAGTINARANTGGDVWTEQTRFIKVTVK